MASRASVEVDTADSRTDPHAAEGAVLIRQARKLFGDFVALNGVDLRVERGTMTAILGPSGCGKTTLLRSIAGLEELQGGEIWINGRLVSAPHHHVATERRNIGFVFQSYAIWPHMTVRQNVAYGLRVKRLPKKEIRERVDNALSLVGMQDFAGRQATDLSGGQQQRVAIARSIVTEPSLLLFDEPLSNLDAKLRDRMRFELQVLLRTLGITAIYVTHDQSEAFALADEVVVMNYGLVQQIGSPMEVYYEPANTFVARFVGLTNFFSGEVESRDGSMAMVRISPSFSACATLRSDAGVGDTVLLCIRPETVETSDSPSGRENETVMAVAQSSYLGDSMAMYGEVAGQDFRVGIDPRHFWKTGSRVPEKLWVTLPADALVEVLDPVGGT